MYQENLVQVQKTSSIRNQSNYRYGEDYFNDSGDRILIQSIKALTALNKPAGIDDIINPMGSGPNLRYNDNQIDQGNTKLEKRYKIPITMGPIIKSRESAAILHSLNINNSKKAKTLTHIDECSPKDTTLQNHQIKNHISAYTTKKNVYPHGTHEITISERAPSIPTSKPNGVHLQTKNYPVVKKKDIYSNSPLFTKKENSKNLAKSRHKRTFPICLINFHSDFWQTPHSRVRRRHLLDML
jgi:hypothetical protein